MRILKGPKSKSVAFMSHSFICLSGSPQSYRHPLALFTLPTSAGLHGKSFYNIGSTSNKQIREGGANVTLYTSKRGARAGGGIRGELLKRSMLVGESSIDSHGCMKGTIKGFSPRAAGESEPIINQTLAACLMVR